ncbi:ABC transporter permease [Actinospica durhamensis]|uniref:ABC transporter permease n=1 Tax=Actinospica durhamensis TaxID=1508375 RepID=A0A941EVJ9_9ACTN|nr:ABC transporter permease [Actinospica durhamensis]MBR7837172.1 ABC transporter permease [Actinospica durhamensis]
MFKATWRNFFAHKGRLALTLLVVVLSVGFVTGTLLFTDTINRTFDQMFASTSADVTVSQTAAQNQEVSASDPTVPASLVSRLATVPGAASVRGEVSTEQLVVTDAQGHQLSSSGGSPTVGTNWDPNGTSTSLSSGHAPQGQGEAVLDADTASHQRLVIGDELKVVAGPGTFTVKIVGLSQFKTLNPGSAFVYFDTPTAQADLLGKTGVFTSVDLTAAHGTSDDQLKANVLTAIGGHYDVKTAAEETSSNLSGLGFVSVLRVALLGFAGIALLVGAFLIVNTFQMLVAQRTRELGLLRALGASRKQVNRSVRTEAFLLGVIGSTLGIGAGYGLAAGLIVLMRGAGLNMPAGHLALELSTPIAGYAVGIIVTLIAAWGPARRAARISPMAALRDAGMPEDRRASRVRSAIGLVVAGGGAAALVAAANSSGGTGGAMLGLGVLATLVGEVLIGPLLASGVIRVLGLAIPRLFGPVGLLAKRNALRNPRRTGATAAALMIGLSLVAGLSVVSSSLLASASAQLDSSVGADFIITANGDLGVTPQALAAAKATPGLAHVTENKDITAKVGSTAAQADFFASSSTMPQDFTVKTVSGDMARVYSGDGIAIPQDLATAQHIRLGESVPVTFTGGSATDLPVVAITSEDTVFNKGSSYVSLQTLDASLPAAEQPIDFMLFAKADPGQADATYKQLQDRLAGYPQLDVKNQADYKALLHNEVAQLLDLVYGLLGLAIVVAILGVINTLALSVVERTREIGLLRAIGLSRRSLRRMIRLESVLIALFGAILGLGLGMGWGISAQRLMATAGLDVLSIPWPTIVAVLVGAGVVGLLAALLPALRASRMKVLRAIATD